MEHLRLYVGVIKIQSQYEYVHMNFIQYTSVYSVCCIEQFFLSVFKSSNILNLYKCGNTVILTDFIIIRGTLQKNSVLLTKEGTSGQVIRYEIVSGAMKLWLGLGLGLLKCLLDTITYVKVYGEHFELEYTIKCCTVINNGIGHKFHNSSQKRLLQYIQQFIQHELKQCIGSIQRY